MITFTQPTLAQLAAITRSLGKVNVGRKLRRFEPFSTAAELIEDAHAKMLKELTLDKTGPDPDIFRKSVLADCITAFAGKSNEVKLQVLTLFGCADLAGLSAERIAAIFGSIGLDKFYSLTADEQNQVVTLLLG